MFVWCTVVTDDIGTTKGAAVLARTLRESNTAYPIWCIVPEGYPAAECSFLESTFDKIIVTSSIIQSVKINNRFKEPVLHMKDFTRWCVFNPELFPVDKVILLAPDMTFLDNCDELFQLKAPALSLSTPWLYPYSKNRHAIKNPHGNLQHGERTTYRKLTRAIIAGEIGLSSMVLISPDKLLYDTMIDILFGSNQYGHGKNDYDLLLIAETFLSLKMYPYNISAEYNWIVGQYKYLCGKNPRVMQFYNGNPWFGIESAEERTEKITNGRWQDMRDWWKIVDNIVADLGEPAAKIFYPRDYF